MKLALDTVMFILLMLMYSKNVISLTFHEAGGLFVLGIMLVHLLINGAWVKAVTKNLFNSTIPVRSKVSWVIDFLLLMCTLVMIITSLLISKKLFPAIGNHNCLNPVHFCTAAVLLVLVGIHCGLHFRFAANAVSGVRRRMNLPVRVAVIAGALAVAGFGIESIAVTSFSHWISAPFNTRAAQQYHSAGGQQRSQNGSGLSDSSAVQGTSQNVQNTIPAARSPVQKPVNIKAVLMLFIHMFSIAMVFAFAVYAVDSAVRRRRNIRGN